MNTNSRSKNGVDVAIEKYKDHPSIKMINENVPFESGFSFKEMRDSDIQKEVFNLTPRKRGLSEIFLRKYLRILPIFVTQYFKIYGIKQYFPKNLRLADITPVYKKRDPTLVENYRPVSVLPCVSKVFERIIQKQFSSFIDKSLSPYLCGYRKGFNTQHALLSLIEKWKETLDGEGYTGAVLMDLSKAFDTINHKLLIAKLYAYVFSKDA